MNKWLKTVHQWFGGDCLLCHAPAQGLGLCAACEADLPWIGNDCRGCGVPLPATGLCGACRRDGGPPYPIRGVLAYQCPVNSLVAAFKFNHGLVEGRLLAGLFAAGTARRLVTFPDLIVPVPLHPARLRERGYNQADILARALGRRLGVPVITRGMWRVRPTRPQSALGRSRDRGRNVAGAFAAQADLRGLTVAMVDDVVTSGATVRAFGDCLRAAGAPRVEVYCCARTPVGSG